MAVERGPMTADELLRGELRTMPLFEWPEACATSEVNFALGGYVQTGQLGIVLAGVGFQLARNPDTVRAPAVAFLRRERVEATGRERGYWPGAPDLAVEVISPNDLSTEVDEKV